MTLTRKALAVAITLLVVSAAAVSPAAAATTKHDLNHSAAMTPNPYIPDDLTKTVHPVGQSLTKYENDNGKLVSMAATVNRTPANPITLAADRINDSTWGLWPRKGEPDNAASILDPSEWTTAGPNASQLSLSSASASAHVDAFRFQTSSMEAGDNATLVYSNFSVTSDEAKRVPFKVVQVDQLEANTEIRVEYVDEDGDYKREVINASRSYTATAVIANGTVDGAVNQPKLGTLTTRGSGDGVFDNIQRIRISVIGGDADVSIAAFRLDRLSKLALGTQAYDGSDDDTDKDDTRTVYEPYGEYAITRLESLPSTFQDATIDDLKYSVNWEASALSKATNVNVTYVDAPQYQNYAKKAIVQYRLTLPDVFDLTHSDLALKDTVVAPGFRYESVQIAEGVGSKNFSDISSWQDVTSKYSSQGETVTLDSSIQVGTSYAYKAVIILSQDQVDNWQDTSTSAPPPIQTDQGGGFLADIPVVGGIVNWFAANMSAFWGTVAAVLGLSTANRARKRRGA